MTTYRWKYVHFWGPRSLVISQLQTWFGRAATSSGLTVAAIVGRSRTTHRSTRRSRPNHCGQFGDRLVCHPVGSPPVGSALPVASCSSNTESFPWTSITRRAFDRSDCKRAFSQRSRANSCSRGSVGGRPGEALSAWSAPSSRCLRHSRSEERRVGKGG